MGEHPYLRGSRMVQLATRASRRTLVRHDEARRALRAHAGGRFDGRQYEWRRITRTERQVLGAAGLTAGRRHNRSAKKEGPKDPSLLPLRRAWPYAAGCRRHPPSHDVTPPFRVLTTAGSALLVTRSPFALSRGHGVFPAAACHGGVASSRSSLSWAWAALRVRAAWAVHRKVDALPWGSSPFQRMRPREAHSPRGLPHPVLARRRRTAARPPFRSLVSCAADSAPRASLRSFPLPQSTRASRPLARLPLAHGRATTVARAMPRRLPGFPPCVKSVATSSRPSRRRRLDAPLGFVSLLRGVLPPRDKPQAQSPRFSSLGLPAPPPEGEATRSSRVLISEESRRALGERAAPLTRFPA
jgi:hypothetical protein